MRVLIISTYELGHQPYHVANAAAALTETGHEVDVLDLAVEAWDSSKIRAAEAAAVSVPMHTALRLAVDAVDRIKDEHAGLPIAVFGLYAAVPTRLKDVQAFAGEYTDGLVEWVNRGARSLGTIGPSTRASADARRRIPQRSGLPALSRYAGLRVGDEVRTAGYVEASSGCRHRCRHCPWPVIYDGRITVREVDSVLADIDRQVGAGARHVTFGDADFLNAPAHSLKVINGVHERHPDVTFDITVKVEHILAHAGLWQQLADAGCLFVVSAFETMADRVLEKLDKGHTRADAGKAVHMLRQHGIEIRPSWLPFTPWTELGDLVDIFAFIAEHDLIPNTDAVQLAIRLLIPPGSLILDLADSAEWLGPYDPDALTHSWRSPNPAVDELQRTLAGLAEQYSSAPPPAAFEAMWQAVAAAAGVDPSRLAIPQGATSARPRMTEPWFC